MGQRCGFRFGGLSRVGSCFKANPSAVGGKCLGTCPAAGASDLGREVEGLWWMVITSQW